MIIYTVVSLVANLRISTGKLNGEKRILMTGLEITPVACVAEQDDDGSMHAALVSLAELEKMELQQGTRDYVNSIVKYADLVLGRIGGSKTGRTSSPVVCCPRGTLSPSNPTAEETRS